MALHSLASRIDDAKPKLIVTAEVGARGGKAAPYKPLLDEAITLAEYKPEKVWIVNRGLTEFTSVAGRDLGYATECQKRLNDLVPIEWVDATHPSYILYTSGTTGKPKSVQRDTGGYAVALAASMKHIFTGNVGETMFCTSDIGWVVGHSYIIYAPLLSVLFSAPTATWFMVHGSWFMVHGSWFMVRLIRLLWITTGRQKLTGQCWSFNVKLK